MLKVLLIIHASSLDSSMNVGGVDAVCQSILEGLIEDRDDNINYRVLAFDPTSSFKETRILEVAKNLCIYHMPIKDKDRYLFNYGFINTGVMIRKHLNQFQPDIIHSHQPYWLIGVNRKYKRIGTFHSYKKLCRTSINKLNDFIHVKVLSKLISYSIDYYTSVGKVINDEIKKDYKTQCSVVYNPINHGFFNENKANTIEGKRINAVFCGVVIPRKRIELAFYFIKNLTSEHYDVNLKILGDIIDKDYHNRLLKLASELGISDNIDFLGKCRKNEVINCFRNSNLGLFFSSEETFGLVPVEMLAANLFVVSTPVGILNEDVNFKKLSALKIISDVDELKRSGSELLEELSINKNNYIENRYAIKNIVKDYENVYLGLK